MTDWTTTEKVRAALGLDPLDVADDEWLQAVVDGVNQFVDDTRPGPAVNPPVIDPRTSWGATQLATRWYSRRNSNDISAFVEMGGAPPSIDRDIEISLQLNRYFGPAIA